MNGRCRHGYYICVEDFLIGNYTKPVLIYNPTAGKLKRNDQRILHRTIEALSKGGLTVTPIPTTGPATATHLARTSIDRGADLVIALGGDGTINEVMNGVVGSNVPLAILPGGTANCLGIETGIGTNPVKAAARLQDYVVRRISVGRVTCSGADRYFISMVGVGLDAQIVSEVNPKIKKATGKFAYWVAGVKQLVKPLKVFEARIGEGAAQQCGFALASRLRNYGGDLVIATKASLLSDGFDTLLFAGSNPLRYVIYMAGVVIRQHKLLPGVDSMSTQAIEFDPLSSRVVYVQADGELIGTLPARVEMERDALLLLTPASMGERESKYVTSAAAHG